jgi:hypothetical protein
MNVIKVISVALATAILIGATGCDPKDVSLLREGDKLVLTGKFEEAREKYAEAAALGNGDAFKKLGDLIIERDFELCKPENPEDFVNGYDNWLPSAKMLIANAQNMYDKAQAAGCTNQMEVSLERLQKCKESVAQIESSVAEVKEKERIRQEELRKQKEEEKRRAEEEAKKRAEEEAKRRAEEAKRNSPEYCIENNLELTSIALNEVIRDLTFHSNTGNKIYDREENARRHARFMGKIITVSGTINKVQLTAFTREVKIIVSVPGGTISARFDGMPRSEAAQFRVGQSIKFSGQISNRPVLSTFAMDRCSIR